MTKDGQEKIVAFDTLFTTNQIQILKILLTYVEPSQQKLIAVYIKFLELQYTITFFQEHTFSLGTFPKEDNFNATKLCEEVLPFCSPSERDKLNQIKSMYQNLNNMQEMMQMMQMMKDLFPESENPANGNPANIFSGLSGFADLFGSQGMDMSQLFEMFQNN